MMPRDLAVLSAKKRRRFQWWAESDVFDIYTLGVTKTVSESSWFKAIKLFWWCA